MKRLDTIPGMDRPKTRRDFGGHAKRNEGPDDERYLHVHARKQFGRITIANSDAGAITMLETAIEQAHRAVNELRNV